MDVEVFSVCDAATDSGGKLNLLGAFDTLFSGKVPFTHPQCAIALRVRFLKHEEGAHKFDIRLVDADGRIVLPPLNADVRVAIPAGGQSSVVNMVLNIQGLRLERHGEYAVNLSVDGKPAASLPLLVRPSA